MLPRFSGYNSGNVCVSNKSGKLLATAGVRDFEENMRTCYPVTLVLHGLCQIYNVDIELGVFIDCIEYHDIDRIGAHEQ